MRYYDNYVAWSDGIAKLILGLKIPKWNYAYVDIVIVILATDIIVDTTDKTFSWNLISFIDEQKTHANQVTITLNCSLMIDVIN